MAILRRVPCLPTFIFIQQASKYVHDVAWVFEVLLTAGDIEAVSASAYLFVYYLFFLTKRRINVALWCMQNVAHIIFVIKHRVLSYDCFHRLEHVTIFPDKLLEN